ncbi:MAG: hypothetical protein FWD17_00135 [Polyangiaceae bacterium]|nr:hypothetical protein [Polyangiaceae bacterium]
MADEDWRLHGQERYLVGARLHYTEYRRPPEGWDHDHCAFCNLKLSEEAGADGARAGWQTEDGYEWICDTCFTDFRERLGFVMMDDGAPMRGVELHDARVLEVTAGSEPVVVRLEAFVHDDSASASGTGCWQRIDLAFYGAAIERRGSGEAGILDGSLQVDDRVFENMLPIPLHETGAVVATMAGVDYELTVRAHGVWLRIAGAPGNGER